MTLPRELCLHVPTIAPSGYSSRFGAETFLVAEDLFKNAVQGMVAEQAVRVATTFQNLLSRDATITDPAGPARTRTLYSGQTGQGVAFTLTTPGTTSTVTRRNDGAFFYNTNAFTRVSFESSNRDVLDVQNDGTINVRNLTSDGSAVVTMTLEFDNQIFTYTTSYTAKTVASYNRDILDALHTVQQSAKAPVDQSIDFAGKRVLAGLSVPLESPASTDYANYSVGRAPYVAATLSNKILAVDGSSVAPQDVVYINSGITSGLLTASGSQANFGWYLNYGQSTQRSIRNLNELTPGTYTLTAVILFDRNANNPQEITRRVTVTILSEVDAVALVSAAIKPGTLLPGGQISSEDKIDLSRYNSEVIGLYVDWTLIDPVDNSADSTYSNRSNLLVSSIALKTGGGAFQLTPTQNYTDEKIFLRANILRGVLPNVLSSAIAQAADSTGSLTGQPQRNFEFTILANPVADIAARIEGRLATWFSLLPSSIQLPIANPATPSSILVPAMYADGIELLRAAPAALRFPILQNLSMLSLQLKLDIMCCQPS
jgi:hypothetical protein